MTYLRMIELRLKSAGTMARIPMPKTPDPQKRALTDDEMARLIETARKSSKRDLSITLVLVDSGMRASELSALEKQDVDLDRLTLTILCGKGGKRRMAFLSPLTARRRLSPWTKAPRPILRSLSSTS
jgi:integrase